MAQASALGPVTTPHPPSSWPTSSLLLFPFPLHSSLPPGWCRVCSSAPAPRALFLSHRRQAARPWTSAGLRPEDLELDVIHKSFPCSMPESGLIQRKYVEEFLTNVLTSKRATDMVKSVLSKLVSGMLSLATTALGVSLRTWSKVSEACLACWSCLPLQLMRLRGTL